MKQMAIIADDLTGASDSGVQFTRKGLATSVIFDTQNLQQDSESVDVVVIDTDSRAIPAEAAYQRVKETAEKLKSIGYSQIYKKLDSTLRGNLGPEIDGVMDVFDFDFAVIAPAFPKIGRTTIEGIHYLNGTPIDETEISRDPKCPVKEANIVTLLSSQSKRKAGLISLEKIRGGNNKVLEHIEMLANEGTKLIVLDAASDTDLEMAVDSLVTTSYRILWVGSAGLADFLPERLQLTRNDQSAFEIRQTEQPVMLVAGSISAITRQQVTFYCEQPNVFAVELNPLAILPNNSGRAEELNRCKTEILSALKKERDIAFFAGTAPSQVTASRLLGGTLGIDATEVSNRIAEALGQVAAEVLRVHSLHGVILTGGDTAKAVCKQLGVSGMKLIRELEAGVPMSQLTGQALLAVTKAGAFGKEQTLVNALKALKGEQHDV